MMYDTFSSDYDRFVNWDSRLSFELPFLEAQLNNLSSPPSPPGRGEGEDLSSSIHPSPPGRGAGVRGGLRVLDAACGTGMHAIALAQRDYFVAGADLSAGMIAQARQNASIASLKIRFEAVGFGGLAEVFGKGSFDALLCLGNSLPHVLTETDLAAALADFALCLRPGGLLILQNRNFDAVLERKERWMEPQAYRQEDGEWIFLRFYDYEPDGLINFNIVTLKRTRTAPWSQQVATTRLRPWRQPELLTALQVAGFGESSCYGSMNGESYQPANSGNLVISVNTVSTSS